MLSDDYLLRALRQLALAIARAMGLRKAGRHDEARAELDAAMGQAFGPLATLLDGQDVATVRALVSDDEKLALYTQLVSERAEIAEASGAPAEAARLRRRADALRAMREPRRAMRDR